MRVANSLRDPLISNVQLDLECCSWLGVALGVTQFCRLALAFHCKAFRVKYGCGLGHHIFNSGSASKFLKHSK